MKNILFSLSIIAFSTIALAQTTRPKVAVVDKLATRLKIHAELPQANALPPFAKPATVTLEDVKVSEKGALFQYQVTLNTYVQSHTCDIGKIESVSLIIERTNKGKTLHAIGTGPERRGGCPEFYSMAPTKIIFTSGIYFDEEKKTIQSESYVIDNSGVKIVITAVKGGSVSAKLEKITAAKP